MKKLLILLLLIVGTKTYAAQIFGNTISLSEFGSFANTVSSLQDNASTRLTTGIGLRTNDFHNLQLKFGNYATVRSITRMGPYLISHASNAAADGNNGPGISFPARKQVGGSSNGALNITTFNTETLIVVGSNEVSTNSPYTIAVDLGALDPQNTFQTTVLTYTGGGGTIKDYNVYGNAFHDYEYNNLEPNLITDVFTRMTEVIIFSAASPGGKTFKGAAQGGPSDQQTLDAAHKLRIKLVNTQSNTTQTWLVYVQRSDNSGTTLPEIVFDANFNGAQSLGMPGIIRATSTHTGFLRLAIVQDSVVPYHPTPGAATEVPDWSTSLGIQIIAATPAMEFMLWPAAFTTKAVSKIIANFKSQFALPFCPWVSIYLPLIARTDIATAKNFFYTLQDKGTSSFDGGTSPFVAYFGMMLGNYFSSDIKTYQNTNLPFPTYVVSATATSIEQRYDDHRGNIPTFANIGFTDPTHQWTYTILNTTPAAPSSGAALIVFPAYKTLDTSSIVLSDFLIQDPTKGPIYAASTLSNKVTFKEGRIPSFLTSNFIPSSFWSKLSSDDQTILNNLMTSALTSFVLPVSSNDAYGVGKVLNMGALSVRYAIHIMEKMGSTDAQVKTATKEIIDKLKSELVEWLITRQTTIRNNNGGSIPSIFKQNFFVGDSVLDGICYSLRGMQGGSNTTAVGQDFGNAFYNDHHFAHGYWLSAAALIVEWDNRYLDASTTPWIAQTHMSGSNPPMGPFKMKRFVDVLWRDVHNPDPEDPDLPYDRYGNPWQAHSTANGLALMSPGSGRNQESLAEDFNCWLSIYLYARAVLQSSGLNATDKMNFTTLQSFAKLNLSITSTGGNLYYNTLNWPYKDLVFNFNAAVGNQWDNFVDTNVFFNLGTPPCSISSGNVLFSKSRINDFYDSFIEEHVE